MGLDSVVDIMSGVLLRVCGRCCCVAAGRKEEEEKAWVIKGRIRRRTPRRRAGRGGSGRLMVMLPRLLWLRRCCVRAGVEEGERGGRLRKTTDTAGRACVLAVI